MIERIQALIDELAGLQAASSTRERALAITKLQEAQLWLVAPTALCPECRNPQAHNAPEPEAADGDG